MSLPHPSVAELVQRLRDHAGAGDANVGSLPPALYASVPFDAFERDALLPRQWFCLGRADEIPRPGDYFTLDLLGEPLLVVRGADLRLRVLSNVCRHRSMLVTSGSGNAKRFVCPYHAWTYDTHGKLLRAPRMGDAEPALRNCRLPELRSEEWHGFVYVNVDGEAEPLAERLAALDPLIARYHTDDMHHVATFHEEWEVNWKCLVENFIEGYHLSVVHGRTLHPLTPTRRSVKLSSAPAFTAYRAGYPPSAPTRGASHPDLTPEERRASTLFCVFPCHLVSQSPDLLVSFALIPSGVGRVRIRWTASTFEPALEASEVERRLSVWHAVNAEDRAVLERLQTGLSSRHAASGPLAPADYEGTIRDFHRFLANAAVACGADGERPVAS